LAPVWYISITDSAVEGLVGETVIMEGHMQSDNWLSVFIINGEAYRDVGKPVWSGGTGGHHGNGPGS